MKQQTPHDQLITVVSSLEGNLSNYREGIIDAELLSSRVKFIIDELKEIIPHTADATWKEPEPEPRLPLPPKTGFEDIQEDPITSEWALRPRHPHKP